MTLILVWGLIFIRIKPSEFSLLGGWGEVLPIADKLLSSLQTHVMLILILIDVQYLQNVVFTFEKGSMVKLILTQIPTAQQITPQQNFPFLSPLNAIWKTLDLSRTYSRRAYV